MQRILIVFLFGGCAADLEATNNGGRLGGQVQEPELAIQTSFADEGNLTTVDASNYDEWVYFSFQSPVEKIEIDSPESDHSWDLGFRRFHIKLNGGVSGSGAGSLSFTDSDDFESFSTVGRTFSTDAEDGDDENDDLDLAFLVAGDGWYEYEKTILTPRKRIYAVTAADGENYKLRIENYYDDAGSAARVSFTWLPF